MKRIVISAVLFFAFVSMACVPSIHPFYENKDVFFDKNLLGKWTDESKAESWIFEKAGSSEYRMEYTDEHGRTGIFETRLFTLRDRDFLDIAPIRPSFIQKDFYGGHLLSAHTFMALSFDGNSVQLKFLDAVWLKNHLEKNPASVGHTIIDGEVLFTDTPKKLKAFIEKNLDTPGAFEETERITKVGEN